MRKHKRTAVGIALIPVILFYVILWRDIINIPFLDDYSGVLGFVCEWAQLHTAHEKIVEIVTYQHNEYKLIVPETIYTLQYLAIGHIDFSFLSALGNLFVLAVYLVLYAIWATECRYSGYKRGLLFVPVSWILFQLQYYSLLNFPGFSLQCITVIAFSLAAICLLSRDRLAPFSLSLVSLLLAVASSGNGFVLVLIGCLMLIQFRRPARLAIWLTASIMVGALYLYKYNFHSSQTQGDQSIISSLHHISPLYALSFLGASIATYRSYISAEILGCCLGICFLSAVADGLYRRRPALFYSMCFVVITSVAVSGLRSKFGIEQSLASRYRIYSNLLLIFSYLYGIDKWFDGGRVEGRLRRDKWMRSGAMATFAVTVVAFNMASNYAGFRMLRSRTILTKDGMCRWERGDSSVPSPLNSVEENPVIQRQRLNGNYLPDEKILREAITLHIYYPPPVCP